MRNSFCIGLVALLLSCSVTIAQEQDDYVQMSGKAYAAFTCSLLARQAGDFDARDRLFTLAHELGTAYLKAQRAGDVLPWNQYETPGLFDFEETRSIDFNLGMTWARIEIEVLANPPPLAFGVGEIENAWRNEFARRNCAYVQ